MNALMGNGLLGEGWSRLPQNIGAAAIWAVLGIALLIAGYKTFDWLLTRVDFDAELNKGNVAVAIVAAAMILGIAIIVHAAIATP